MITVTKEAAEYINTFLDNSPDGIGLRLAVKGMGCSGFGYEYMITNKLHDTDNIYEHFGIKVLVAEHDLKYLDGLEIRFVQEGLNKGLGFINPNSTGACGCGESFSI